jgi:hypothetical protein
LLKNLWSFLTFELLFKSKTSKVYWLCLTKNFQKECSYDLSLSLALAFYWLVLSSFLLAECDDLRILFWIFEGTNNFRVEYIRQNINLKLKLTLSLKRCTISIQRFSSFRAQSKQEIDLVRNTNLVKFI